MGKSIALSQAVLHARKKGWLCLYIPRGWAQAQAGSYIEPALRDNFSSDSDNTSRSASAAPASSGAGDSEADAAAAAVPVETYMGDAEAALAAAREDSVFDNHEMSAEALRGFLRAHAAQLRTVPVRDLRIMDKYAPYREKLSVEMGRYVALEGASFQRLSFVQQRAIVEGDQAFPHLDKMDEDVLAGFNFIDFEPKTLEDLALLGVALRELSGSLFLDIVAELRALDRPDMPVLIAVDEYNCWEVPSAYSFDDRKIMAKQLCVPHALNFLSMKKAETDAWTLKNGMCIGEYHLLER